MNQSPRFSQVSFFGDEIDEISSRLHCEVVLDGIDRFKVNRIVKVEKFSPRFFSKH